MIGLVCSKERVYEVVVVIEKVGGYVIELDNMWGLDRIWKIVEDLMLIYGEIDVLVNNVGGLIMSLLENFM